MFITIIGLKNNGLAVGHEVTLVSMLEFSKWQNDKAYIPYIYAALVAFFGLMVIGILYAKNVKGSIFIGIISVSILLKKQESF